MRPERGIRQGDPISPYLYIICVEGLSMIIRRNQNYGLLHGCKISQGASVVSICSSQMIAISFSKKQKQNQELWRTLFRGMIICMAKQLILASQVSFLVRIHMLLIEVEFVKFLELQRCLIQENIWECQCELGRKKMRCLIYGWVKSLSRKLERLHYWRQKPNLSQISRWISCWYRLT